MRRSEDPSPPGLLANLLGQTSKHMITVGPIVNNTLVSARMGDALADRLTESMPNAGYGLRHVLEWPSVNQTDSSVACDL